MVCVRKKLKSNKEFNEKHDMIVASKDLERKNGAKGITLIALVITIIVLLILAAVSIATLTGDNGILTKAQNAKEKNDAAEKEETAKLTQAEANMSFEETEYNGVTIPAGMAPTRKEGESTVDEGLVAIDKNGNEWVWIEVPKTEMPSGLTFENETGYSEKDEANCATITAKLKGYADPYTKGGASQNYSWTDEWYDKLGTTYDGKNEYSEVKYIDKNYYSGDSFLKAKEYYGTIYKNNTGTEEATSYEYGTTYYANITGKLDDSLGCGLTYDEYKETYQKMIKSVYANGGFWIGRYEAGIEGTTGTDEESLKLGRTSASARITDVLTSPKAISKKDAIPYNCVYCSEAQKLANEMRPNSSKTSSLLFGIQWDLVCKFIEEKEVKKQGESNRESIKASINSDSGEWGNYANQFSVQGGKLSMYAHWSGSALKDWQVIIGAFQKPLMAYPDNGYTLFSTGITERNKRINIYDFAGNEDEYTLEYANSLYCVAARGGTFYETQSIYQASDRNRWGVGACNEDNGFRVTLY